MNLIELLATLKAKDIQLAVSDDQLRVQGNKQALSDPAVLALLREHKAALIELIKAGGYSAAKHGQVEVPANGIVPGTPRITPAMVTLAEVSQDTLDELVADVPGGAENVQDIYPLAPLQEGILFHHASGGEGDPYVMQAQFAFTDMQRFQAFAQALQTVINRHDILRTAVVWEGLDAPLQVVWRRAHLPLEEFVPQDGEADALAQLNAHFDPRHFRLDVSRAPMLRLAYAKDTAGQRIVATLLFHHMAMDHSALEVVSHEMRECLSGQGARLGRPVPFRNYVAQARLGISEAEHEAFFRDMLGDIDEPTLPFGLQDVQGDGQGIAELGMPVEPELGQRLRTQARQLGVSAASLFHLAWAQVLATLTGKPSVVFGTVLMGRLQGAEAIDRALGIFINTLPVRLDIDGQGVRAAVQATHARLTTLMRHEHAPLALAQRCSQVAAPTPLFSALFNYRHSHGAAAAHAQAQTAWEGITNLHAEERSNYPLTLSVDDFGDAFRLMLLASTQLDPQRVCGYMHCAVEGLVQALEQTPDVPVDELSVLPTAEREQVLSGFNATAVDYPQGLTTQQRFEAQAEQRPDAVAAAFLGEQLTYADLNRRANALARHLTGLGVGPDDRVAIVARRGLDTLVGLVAILKAGAGYVPVDPSHPAERLEYLLSDSAPVAVLTQSGLRERLPALDVPVLDLDLAQWPADDAGNPQVPGLTPEHLAYVIYTSGSTGLPKGVMVEHQTLGNLIDWHCAAFDLCAGLHTSSLAGFGFDAMAWEVWPALCAGATLHLAPVHDGTEDIDALLGWWREQPLDVSFLPTPVAEYAFGQNIGHPTLRTLLIGGDRLRQFGRSQTFDVINNYGPTEATVVATSGRIEAGQTLHIGRPVANATVYLLDEQQRPVPIGVAGELYVGGAGVARGYLNRPELTEERFLQDPFNPGRMYRTGDLARWREDGSIEYLGRNDDQVKIRGVRIELGEIESRLNHLPGIQEAVLLAREDEPGQVRLVAYFTAQAQVEPLEVGELRAHLLTQLPEYMVPTAFVRLDALPLTANGKLDRRALPKPERSALFTREYEAPQGELENALAQVWAEVLQVERVGRHDHFFELGGHSLLAMRMVSQVRQRLGVELALSDLFANAELAAVAEVLSRAGRSTLPDIVPAPRDQALPLSFAQQRLWFLSQMEGANTAYNIPIALRLRGRLNGDALQQALARIVARHETLRSRFTAVNDEAQVLIAPVDSGLPLQTEDLRRHPQADEALLALIEGEASAPFDLEDDPLIRGRLVRMADDHHVLLLTLHHIVTDGWSMGVLTRELTALYQAFSHGEPDPLPPLALQYTDYAVWQRRWLSGEVLQRQSDYWRQTLSGAPALLALPTDRPRPAQQDYAGRQIEITLDERLTAGLNALCQRHGVTLYMVLTGAWAMLMARLSGQADVVIGSPVANRGRAEIEGLIGMFVNTLALRIDTSGELNTEALLAQVKARTLEAQAHQDLPFEQVVDIVKPERSLAHSPLFQTLFSWESRQGERLVLDNLALEGVAEPSHFAKFDLSLTLREAQGELRGTLEYATALFDEATVVRYFGYLQRLLQAMASDDHAVLEQVPMLAEDERQALLFDLNATDVGYDLQQTIHGLFEAQALRTPQAVAVKSGDRALSYTELNRQANRLARHLRGLGVGPDARVGICVERSPEMVVGLLAILKAGGGYVPLDPAYPAERLAYMLDDSAPLAVLVHGATRRVLGESAAQVVDLDKAVWASQPADNLPAQGLTPQHMAYVIYTSGSTGQPKGVINEHSGVVNRLLWMQDAYRLS
ncbi:amino acid adenylation domain-containing protein, partial [Pseudomonas sp. NPDC089534]|uniref:amino acid adenylation domain-containing protein n=1 Tax=Pseudomonas sp. NPDC089534 TaxID=3364468 RepID=UPI0037FB9ABD